MNYVFILYMNIHVVLVIDCIFHSFWTWCCRCPLTTYEVARLYPTSCHITWRYAHYF